MDFICDDRCLRIMSLASRAKPPLSFSNPQLASLCQNIFDRSKKDYHKSKSGRGKMARLGNEGWFEGGR
jgi:hypothetical protein